MLRPLKPGATIAVIAPAFPPDAEKLAQGLRYLKDLGYRIVEGQSLTAKEKYFAGSDALRADELNRFFADPQIDALICARGGWGTLRFLDKLNFEIILKNPKILVGYSDITTLQLAIWQKAQIPSLSGPMVAVEMGSGILPFTEQHFWAQIQNEAASYSFRFDCQKEVEVWREGRAQGRLIGGCLSMVAHQLGTPYMPDVAGSILFLEDVGEEPYKIDRYLAQLRQAGLFDKITALILGQFIDCTDTNPSRASVGIKDVLQDYFAEAPYPVIVNFPYGHGMRKFSMPIGVQAELSTENCTLTVENPFFS